MQNGREGADGSSPMIGLPIAKENAKFARPRHTPRGAQSSQSVHEYHSDILHLLLSRPRYRVGEQTHTVAHTRTHTHTHTRMLASSRNFWFAPSALTSGWGGGQCL
jgi:hypothetical protein